MLNERETQIILEQFFEDCKRHWTYAGYDERKAFEFAISDVEFLERDPFSPFGNELDQETKEKFIKYRKQDLEK